MIPITYTVSATLTDSNNNIVSRKQIPGCSDAESREKMRNLRAHGWECRREQE